MTIGVVKVFEMVNVKHNRREWVTKPFRARYLSIADLKKATTVVQARERVSDGQPLHLAVEPFQFGIFLG